MSTLSSSPTIIQNEAESKRLFSQQTYNTIDETLKKQNITKEKVIQVCSGNGHTLILTQSKRIYSIGSNEYGQLGLGDKNDRCALSLIDPDHFDREKIIQVCTGLLYSMALTQNGNVYSWGRFEGDELRNANKSNYNIPQKIDNNCFNNEPIKYISAGAFFSFALTKNNNLYSRGGNRDGQLGLGNNGDRWKQTLIDSNTYNNEKIIKIECGCFHTLLLTEKPNGSTNIYSCGWNYHGQLGLNHNYNKNTFKLIDPKHFENQKIKDIKSTGDSSIALIEQNNSNKIKVYGWGSNYHGQLGLGDEEDMNIPCEIDFFNKENIKSISNRSHHLFAITKQQGSNKTKVYAWGNNGEGQLGLGHYKTSLNPTVMNMNYFKMEKIVSIAGNIGSRGCSFAITKTGKLFAWGWNADGQLGLSNCKQVNEPQLCFPDLFGVEKTNQKLYNNQSFEDLEFEFG